MKWAYFFFVLGLVCQVNAAVIPEKMTLPFHQVGVSPSADSSGVDAPHLYFLEDDQGAELFFSSRTVRLPKDFVKAENEWSKSIFEAQSRDQGSVGTAWYVSRNTVMTNRHVYGASMEEAKQAKGQSDVLSCDAFEIKKPGNALARAQTGSDTRKTHAKCERVLFCSTVYDYCLIQVDRPGPPLKISDVIMKSSGHEFSLIGNSKGVGIVGSRGRGVKLRQVNDLDPELPRNLFILSHYVPSFQGSSGSPVLRDDGVVVGINYAEYRHAEIDNSAMNLAVPGYVVKSELKKIRPDLLEKMTFDSSANPWGAVPPKKIAPIRESEMYAMSEKIQFQFQGKMTSVMSPIASTDRCGKRYKGFIQVCGQAEQVTLEGKDLSGVDLRGMNFLNANLDGVRFDGANLTGIGFYHMAQGSTPASMRLNGVSFVGSNLEDSVLIAGGMSASGLNLTDSKLSFASMTFGELKNSDLTRAELRGVMMNIATFRNLKMNEVIATGGNLSNSRFFDVDFSGTPENPTQLNRSFFTDSVFVRCQMRYVNLRGADLRGARDYGMVFDDTVDLKGAIFDQYTKLSLTADQLKKRGAIYRETVLD